MDTIKHYYFEKYNLLSEKSSEFERHNLIPIR